MEPNTVTESKVEIIDMSNGNGHKTEAMVKIEPKGHTEIVSTGDALQDAIREVLATTKREALREMAQAGYSKAIAKTLGKIANQKAVIAGALARETVDKDTGRVTYLYADGTEHVITPRRK